MIEVNAAGNATKTAAYYWDNNAQRFGLPGAGYNQGFVATHKIIVNAELTAQELDAVFAAVI